MLKGSFILTDVQANATYKIAFAGKAQAPGQNPSGEVSVTAEHLFADIEVALDKDLVPQNIRSWAVRGGQEKMVKNTGLGEYKNLDIAGMRKSLLEVMEIIFAKNGKVQVNQAIQAMKKEAAE